MICSLLIYIKENKSLTEFDDLVGKKIKKNKLSNKNLNLLLKILLHQ